MDECQIGVGLRPDHYPYLENRPQTSIKWFEVISENYMDSEGRPIEMLELIRNDYPVGLHGVSMSLGSKEGVSLPYLKKLKQLIKRIDPFLVTDHLCWTGLPEANLHNLLPLVYDEKNLNMIVSHIDEAQNFLGQQISVENLSAYFSYKESTFTEWDFLRQVAVRSGCKILLDINNIFVNSHNHKFDPYAYLRGIPAKLVGEIHLAGFTDMGDYYFDTHSKPVHPPVWELFSEKIKDLKNVPILVEWDEDIPDFSVLEKEAMKARQIWGDHHE